MPSEPKKLPFEIEAINPEVVETPKCKRVGVKGDLRIIARGSNEDYEKKYGGLDLWDSIYLLMNITIDMEETGEGSGYYTSCACGDRGCAGFSVMKIEKTDNQLNLSFGYRNQEINYSREIKGVERDEFLWQVHNIGRLMLKLTEDVEFNYDEYDRFAKGLAGPEHHTWDEFKDKLDRLEEFIDFQK